MILFYSDLDYKIIVTRSNSKIVSTIVWATYINIVWCHYTTRSSRIYFGIMEEEAYMSFRSEPFPFPGGFRGENDSR